MPSQNRAAPVVIIIFLLTLLAVLAPLLAEMHPDPETWVGKIQAMSQSQPDTPRVELKHAVWVNRRSGLYYCRQSKFYGRISPGESMGQGSALLKGYRPAQGQVCP